MITAFEACAGAGGQALGLEAAGFEHVLLVDNDSFACSTLRTNRPMWSVSQADLRSLSGSTFRNVDVFAAGVPCPPFSVAGKQLGTEDERDLFPTALRLIEEMRPAAIILENVPGFASQRFSDYRLQIVARLVVMGYEPRWTVLNACEYGVPQLRPRFVLVAMKEKFARWFHWPEPSLGVKTVGDALHDLMGSRGWSGAGRWAEAAQGVAPTLVGGSKKHGGPDLGPTRARAAWLKLNVDGRGLADSPPGPDTPVDALPRLTVRMAARIQGFPDQWVFDGGKTASYRQVGNAFPPPIARAIGSSVARALQGELGRKRRDQTTLLSRAG